MKVPAMAASLDIEDTDVQEIFFERGWTDGLPIVPPTPELVSSFLEHANLRPDEVIGSVVSWSATVTAEQVAINAVMAGCLAEYLPTVVAAVRALTAPAANCWTNCATTNNPSQVIVMGCYYLTASRGEPGR